MSAPSIRWSLVLPLGIVVALGVVLPASAAVDFEPWHETAFSEAVDRAARESRPVVLVISQPDWCPPCIKLDRRWLRNAADTAGREAVAGSVVLEVLGYERDGAALLERQRVLFQGTPTTHVYAAPIEGRPLGDARLLGSIVGAPDDWPTQVASLLAGTDPVGASRRAVLDAGDPLTRARALVALGDVLAARGEASEAARAYRRVEWMTTRGLDDPQVSELRRVKREAHWQRVANVDLRVRKDYAEALRGIDGWRAAHVPTRFRPDLAELEDVAYARAWALAHLGRVDEAMAELDAALPETAEGELTFLYFCFRSGDHEALRLAERRAALAIARHPERRAALLQAAGRIHRKRGMLEQAERAFEEAVALAPEGETRATYEGQLETVRRELAARGGRTAEGAGLSTTGSGT